MTHQGIGDQTQVLVGNMPEDKYVQGYSAAAT
jgi:hypothetical protein